MRDVIDAFFQLHSGSYDFSIIFIYLGVLFALFVVCFVVSKKIGIYHNNKLHDKLEASDKYEK